MKHLAKARTQMMAVTLVHKVALLLAKAHITLNERSLGYPHHVWYAMGNMSEAEDELVEFMPEQAARIRTERLKIQDALTRNEVYFPKFKELMYEVADAAMLEEIQ